MESNIKSFSTSHHMVTNDVYNDGQSGPSLGRLLPSHRGTKLLSDGDYRDYIVYAQCGPAWRRSPISNPPHNIRTAPPHAQPPIYSILFH